MAGNPIWQFDELIVATAFALTVVVSILMVACTAAAVPILMLTFRLVMTLAAMLAMTLVMSASAATRLMFMGMWVSMRMWVAIFTLLSMFVSKVCRRATLRWAG